MIAQAVRSFQVIEPASFGAFNDKRQTIRNAIDHVVAEASDASQPAVALGADAPFGEVIVDTGACTLCLACVTVCPGRALQDGESKPQLKLIESACLQCGLCEKACPESAITLRPRYLYDSEQARSCLLYTSPSPRDKRQSRMPSSA